MGHLVEIRVRDDTHKLKLDVIVEGKVDLADGTEREEDLRVNACFRLVRIWIEDFTDDFIDVLVLLRVANGCLLQLGALGSEDNEAIRAFKHLYEDDHLHILHQVEGARLEIRRIFQHHLANLLIYLPLHALVQVRVAHFLVRVGFDGRDDRPHSLWLQVASCEEGESERWNGRNIENSRPKEHGSEVGHEECKLKQEANPLILDPLLLIFERSCEGHDDVDELVEEDPRPVDQKVRSGQKTQHVELVQPEFPKLRILLFFQGIDNLECQ